MRALASLPILLLLAAGCASPAKPELPDVPDVDDVFDVASLFKEPILVGKGGDAETSLYVSPSGQTILACSHGGFTQPSPMWYSTDAGNTWSRYDASPHPVSGDCDVSEGPEGNWYMLYDTIGSASVSRSKDHGKTWNIVYDAAIPFGGVDRPWIQAAGENVVYVTYANVMVSEPAVDAFVKSTDGGATWSRPNFFAVFDRTYPNTITGHMVLSNANRTIRVPLSRTDTNLGGPSVFDVATTRDGGDLWSTSRVVGPIDAPLQLPAMTVTGDGTLYFVVTSGPVESAAIDVYPSTDGGKTWGEPIHVADDQNFPGLSGVWIDGRAGSSATLAWMHTVDQNGSTAWVVSVARLSGPDAPVEFEGDLFSPIVGEQAVYEFLMVRHDEAGQAHILYAMFGDGCTRAPPGLEAQGRNTQCVWLWREKAPTSTAT